MAWVVLGLLLLIVVIPLAYALLKDDPAELGLLPDGDPQPLVEGQTASVRPGPLEVEHWQDSFRSTPIWQLCGGYFVCGFTIALISTHFMPFAIERGVSATTAATAYGLMSGLNVVGVLAVKGHQLVGVDALGLIADALHAQFLQVAGHIEALRVRNRSPHRASPA